MWALSPWHVYVALIFVALGCILLIAGLATPNPLSLSVRASDSANAQDSVLGITRHPLLWALGLWGLSHVVVNGDVASVILFGILASFALGYMPLMDKRVQKSRGMEDWQHLSAGSSNLLFAAYLRGNTRPLIDRTLAFSIIGGLGLFFALLILHSRIIGVNPLGAIL